MYNYQHFNKLNDSERTFSQSQWSVKKKKSRQPSTKQDKQTNDESANTDDWNENQGTDQRDKPRSKSGGPNYRRGGDGGSRGWRGREKQVILSKILILSVFPTVWIKRRKRLNK